MEDKRLIIQLKDCFTAGYTFPQFCIDKGIKKPLFVAPNSEYEEILWEIYVQFKYDRRITASFAFIYNETEMESINYSVAGIIGALKMEMLSNVDPKNFDKIIVLTNNPLELENADAIYLSETLNYFIRRAYAEVPLLHVLQRYPQVQVIMIPSPRLIQHANNTEFEKKILAKQTISAVALPKKIEQARKEGKIIPTPYDFLGYDNDTVYKLLGTPKRTVESDGSVSLADDEFIGIKDGKRMTAYQPEKYENTIYFFGTCILYGYGVPWNKTAASYLQKLLNENNLPYRVENYSQFANRRRQDAFYNLDKLSLKAGDIVFVTLFARFHKYTDFPYWDINRAFLQPHNEGEIFPDTAHINELGQKILAEHLFTRLKKNNFFRDKEFNYPIPPPPVHRYGIPQENFSSAQSFLQNKELDEYKEKLRAKRVKIGAIVMNCNPFTLGHEYLVEYASKKVDKLFIFVVEEDKSEFKFADRFKLVQAGVKKFPNVEVLPSGKFIISQQTFSGYFNKAELQDVPVDSSEDVEIFAREIAPSLGITVRFVGEEPGDTVTRQYNENMRKILPQYNIEFCEIPRKETGGEVISAKRVRAALKVGDFDTIKKLVPKTTLRFLRENFTKN